MDFVIADELIKESMALPAEERLELACRLLESVEMAEPSGATQLVIDQRAEEVKAGAVTVPGGDVFRRLREIAPDRE